MKLKRSPAEAPIRLELLDEIMDSYVDWRRESHAVAELYRSWTSATRNDRGPAFRAYRAALDREERAACRYAQVVEHGHVA